MLTGRFHGRHLNFLILLLSMIITCFYALSWWDFTHDDAYISFRYAENLVQGNGLVFNPGERVEGYTNFLWTLMSAVVIAFGGDPAIFSKILGLISALATLVIVSLYMQKISSSGNEKNVSFAPAILSFFVPFSFWAIGGLETSFFTFWVTIGLLHTVEGKEQKLFSKASLFLVIASFTRPDGLYFWVIAFTYSMLIASGRRYETVFKWFMPHVVFFLPYFIWRWSYYGWLFPNTYYVRMGTDFAQNRELWYSGFHYLLDFFSVNGGISLIFFLFDAILITSFRGKKFFVAVISLTFLHLIRVGGDEKVFSRLIVPVLPLLAILLAEWIRANGPRIRSFFPVGEDAGSAFSNFFRRILAVFVPLLLFIVLWGVLLQANNDKSSLNYIKRHISLYCIRAKAAGQWIHKHALPGETMAARAIGILGYYGKIPCFDLLGIVDEHIAHLPLKPGQATAHGKSDLIHIIRKKPTYVFFMLHNPEKMGYRPFKIHLDIDRNRAKPMLLFKYDPTLSPDTQYMKNPDENQGLLKPVMSQ